MSRATIKDIAQSTGTSVASVHRALHGSDGVGEALRKRILEEARKRHYHVDESASLLRREPLQIAVLLPKAVGNERFYYRGLWQGIRAGTEQLKKSRINVRCFETDYGIDQLSSALERLYDRFQSAGTRMDGLVTICDDAPSLAWIQRFIRLGTKVALVDRGAPFDGIVCSVAVSVEDMARSAMGLIEILRDRSASLPILLVNGSKNRTSYQAYSRVVRDYAAGSCGVRVLEINTEDERQTREHFLAVLGEQPLGGIITASARSTYWICDELERWSRGEKAIPPLVGTDVFAEQRPFYESGTLIASICQSHTSFGARALDMLLDSLIDLDQCRERQILEPVSIVMKHNYQYYL